MNKLSSLVILLSFFAANYCVKGQCGCANSPPIVSSIPFAGSANAGFLNPDENRGSFVYRYAYGDTYYSGDSKAQNVYLKDFLYHYIALDYSRGLSENINISAELSGFALKKQTATDAYFNQESSGLSRIAVLGKYNAINESYNDIELDLSLGLAIPLRAAKNDSNDNIQKHIQTSTGAFGGIFEIFIHKYYKGFNLFLINRSEYNFKNNLDYKYGASFYTSLLCTKKITREIAGILELRNEFRLKDKNNDATESETGGAIMVLSPQVDYNFGVWNLSANFDYPFYKYYYGKQPVFSYTCGLSASWKF